MSDDEVFVLLLSGAGAIAGAAIWYGSILSAGKLGANNTQRQILAVLPLLALLATFIVLKTLASFDVRDSTTYLFFYVVLGATWLTVGYYLFTRFGISALDDVIERKNQAALILIAACQLSLSFCYTGANIGDGPGWWCVVFAGMLSTGAWLLLWWLIEVAADAEESITVDRNVPTALRLGGYMIASGLILGRGAAGDWTSAERTLIEFGSAWPAVPLAIAVIIIERFARRLVPSAGVSLLFALVFIGYGSIALFLAPPLPQNPKYDQPTGQMP